MELGKGDWNENCNWKEIHLRAQTIFMWCVRQGRGSHMMASAGTSASMDGIERGFGKRDV